MTLFMTRVKKLSSSKGVERTDESGNWNDKTVKIGDGKTYHAIKKLLSTELLGFRHYPLPCNAGESYDIQMPVGV